ncbi:hypothetical protein GHK01_31725 [Sinorhizobium meliloti]|uniref:DUF6074 family protein n=1 Tax=Rhizobium meliloti TaxID=382 RepID=UPI001296D826|nr:DUF6074 family protein [Sinorhizobium meliloti]MQV31031.1 hypothetical protein [Sinorhizobium meliloti]
MVSQNTSSAGHLPGNEDTSDVVPFPLGKRIGKIRSVAEKLLRRTSAHHAEYYRHQVNVALARQLRKVGIAEHVVIRELREFWSGVEQEMDRMSPSSPRAEPRH